MSDAPGARSQLLSLRDISYSYPSATGPKQVLRNVSTDVWPGEIVLMVGPSGAGKTTILTLAGALRTVEQGSLIVLQQELRGASRKAMMQVRKQIGFVFQNHNLLESLTVLDNVQTALMPLASSGRERQDCIEILRAVGVGEYIRSHPRKLSGGQQQRVAIARALVRKPRLVLADEPTASLDRASGREIVELLRHLARVQGCAIVMVTHDSRILDLADRCLRLEDGVLSSYAGALTADSAHMLTALSAFPDSEGLDWYWSRMDSAAFLDALGKLRGEAAQFLNAMEFGANDSLPAWVETLLGSVLGKAAALVDAPCASIRTVPSRRRQIALHRGPETAAGEPAALEIHDREGNVIGVAEFRRIAGEALAEANQRRLRDFEKPLGLLLEMCIRIRGRAESN